MLSPSATTFSTLLLEQLPFMFACTAHPAMLLAVHRRFSSRNFVNWSLIYDFLVKTSRCKTVVLP